LYHKPPQSPAMPLLDNKLELTSLTLLLESVTSRTIEAVWGQVEPQEFRYYLEDVSEHLTAFEEAAQADYLECSGSRDLYFLNLREVSRVVFYRSTLALHEGRGLDAAYDIRMILSFGCLFMESPTLVEQMIGASIRETGMKAAYGFIESQKKNEQSIQLISDVFNKLGPRMRVGINFQELARGGDGTGQTVVPNADFILPAFGRAFNNSMMCWLNFDRLEVAAAVELFRIQNGVYPEKLQDLNPAYLKRIPRNPFDGKAYQYKATMEGEYELSPGQTPGKEFTQPLVLPFSKASR
jgi:hypothetical protein